jgi:hypothetical protein
MTKKKTGKKAAPRKGAAALAAMQQEIEDAKPEPQNFADVLVPEGSVRDVLRTLQLRRKTKYLCGRMRKEAVEGVDAPELPDGFKKFYEGQEHFTGWGEYNTSWDIESTHDEDMNPIVDEFRPLLPVERWESVWEEWDQVVDSHMRSGVISARKRKRQKP